MGQTANRPLLEQQQLQHNVVNQQSPCLPAANGISNTSKLKSNKFNNHSRTTSSIKAATAAHVSVHSSFSSSTSSLGCFKCNKNQEPVAISSRIDDSQLYLSHNLVNLRNHNNNTGLFKKMRQRIRYSLNRLSTPEYLITTSPTQKKTTDQSVCRSQTDYSLVKLTSDSSQQLICDYSQPQQQPPPPSTKPLRNSFTKSPAMYQIANIYSQQNDDTVRISDLLEDNESLSSYDDDNIKQQKCSNQPSSSKNVNTYSLADNTLTPSTASSSSITLSHRFNQQPAVQVANKEQSLIASESLCYIDELAEDVALDDDDDDDKSTIDETTSKSSRPETESSVSLHSSILENDPDELLPGETSSFMNQVNKKLMHYIVKRDDYDQQQQQHLRLTIDYYLDWETNRNNDNISIYNQCFYFSSTNRRISSSHTQYRAPLASSETTTLSGSITQLNNSTNNSYSIMRRIKI